MNSYKLFSPGGMEVGSACGVCHTLATVGNADISERCCSCSECGKPLSEEERKRRPFYHDQCDQDRHARWQKERLEKAGLVTDYDGPVYLEGVGNGSYGNGYFANVQELSENLDLREGERPEFAFCCESRGMNLDVDNIIDNLTEESFEDAADHLNGVDQLNEAVIAFNLANKDLVCWDADYERKVAIPAPTEVRA